MTPKFTHTQPGQSGAAYSSHGAVFEMPQTCLCPLFVKLHSLCRLSNSLPYGSLHLPPQHKLCPRFLLLLLLSPAFALYLDHEPANPDLPGPHPNDSPVWLSLLTHISTVPCFGKWCRIIQAESSWNHPRTGFSLLRAMPTWMHILDISQTLCLWIAIGLQILII